MLNSKHRYSRCLLIKILDHIVLFSLFTKICQIKKMPEMKHTFLLFWNLKPLVTCNKMNHKFALSFVCIIFAHWCVTRHSHFPLSLKLETWLGKPTPTQTFSRKVIFWMHYFWMRSKLMKDFKFLCPLMSLSMGTYEHRFRRAFFIKSSIFQRNHRFSQSRIRTFLDPFLTFFFIKYTNFHISGLIVDQRLIIFIII